MSVTDENERWSLEAKKARSVAARAGPFRFLPIRVLELEGVHMRLKTTATGDGSSDLHSTFSEAMEALARRENIARLDIHQLHLDFLDDAGTLACCITAAEAGWSVGKNAGSAIALRREVRFLDARGSSHSSNARLDFTGRDLSSNDWAASSSAPALHSEQPQGSCPLRLKR